MVRKGKGKGTGKPVPSAVPRSAPATRAPTARGPATRAPAARAPTARDPAARAPAAPAPPARAPAGRTPAKTALKSPKSAAVVLSLQPEAAEKGITYSAVLQMAQEKVDLQELGIERLRFRQTATGARMLEIPGSQNSEKADRLAEKLRGALAEVASISRPTKSVDLRITGLDDAATKEKVVAAIAKAGSCDARAIKSGEIRPGPRGAGSALISCPVVAAKALLQKGRLLIGWSSVQVVALEERPMRCFKCMGLGHTRPQCPAAADRGDLCFRCGSTGHKMASCEREVPKCAICAETGRPSGHIMGSRSCAPPRTKGQATRIQATPAAARPAAAPPAEARPPVLEEVAMSD